MPRNIPLIIEYVAFLGLICCLIIYNTNIVFLSIIIAFVALEIMMESFQVQLKQKIAHIYNAIFLLSALITNIISNGFYLSTVFPVFFMAVLLFVARYINVLITKTKTRTRSLERGDTVYQSFKDAPIKYILHLYKKANTFLVYKEVILHNFSYMECCFLS